MFFTKRSGRGAGLRSCRSPDRARVLTVRSPAQLRAKSDRQVCRFTYTRCWVSGALGYAGIDYQPSETFYLPSTTTFPNSNHLRNAPPGAAMPRVPSSQWVVVQRSCEQCELDLPASFAIFLHVRRYPERLCQKCSWHLRQGASRRCQFFPGRGTLRSTLKGRTS